MSDILKSTVDAVIAIESGEAAEEQVAAALGFVSQLKEQTRALAERVEAAAIAWIEKNREIEIGPVRYYVAPNKTTRCLSVRGVLEAVLRETGGDLDAVSDLLSSSAWKHGSCRKRLSEEAYNRLFVVEVTSKLETGEARKRLQKTDERFQ